MDKYVGNYFELVDKSKPCPCGSGTRARKCCYKPRSYSAKKKVKQKPNDKCTCGSGRKYKKCCYSFY